MAIHARLVLLLVVGNVLCTVQARAQDALVPPATDAPEPAAAELEALRAELARLAGRVEELETAERSEVPAPEPAPAPSNDPVITGTPGNGLGVRIGDAFSLNVRSRIQLRYQLAISREDAMGERTLDQLVNIGTARLWFSGHVLVPELTYMIQLAIAGRDFRDGATSPIFDAYLDYRVHRDFAVRAGQFFVPFDRLRTVREWALQMADRPRPVLELTLDRDVGIVLYSERFLADDSPFAWRVGVFGGGGTNLSAGRPPGALVMGRLELRPFGTIDDDIEGDLERRADPRLAIGAGFAANLGTNRLRSTTGPTFAEGTTDYFHAAADAVFKWGGFALQLEYLWKQASGDQLPDLAYTRSGHGWIAQASYVFDPPIEIVARVSQLYALGATDPTLVTEATDRGVEVAAGLNYYFNGHRFKLQADWIARAPSSWDLSVADHVVHLQLDATF